MQSPWVPSLIQNRRCMKFTWGVKNYVTVSCTACRSCFSHTAFLHAEDDSGYSNKEMKELKKRKPNKPTKINTPNPKHMSSVLRFSIKHYISWLNGSAQNSECTNTVTELWVQYSPEMHLQHAWKYWTLQKRWLVCAGANKDQGARDLKLNWEQKTFYKIFSKRMVKNLKDHISF